jgi:hypothetical protein
MQAIQQTINSVVSIGNIPSKPILDFLKVVNSCSCNHISLRQIGVTYANASLCLGYYDRHSALTAKIPAVFDGNFSATVSAKDLKNALGKSKDFKASFSDDTLVLNGFPLRSVGEWTNKSYSGIIVNKLPDDFFENLPSLLQVIAKESPRQYGQVINIRTNEHESLLAGTQGFHLMQATARPLPFTDEVNIPYLCAKAITEINKQENGALFIGISEDKTTLVIEACAKQYAFRLSPTKFPAYESIFPKQSRTKIAVNAPIFLAALKEMKPFLDKYKVIEFRVIGEKLRLTGFREVIKPKVSYQPEYAHLAKKEEAKEYDTRTIEIAYAMVGALPLNSIRLNCDYVMDSLHNEKGSVGIAFHADMLEVFGTLRKTLLVGIREN